MLRRAPGTLRLASVKPPFLFNHPLSALWVGALQVSRNAEGYRGSATFHGNQTSIFLSHLIFQTDAQEEPFAVCNSIWGILLGVSMLPLWHYGLPLIKSTDLAVHRVHSRKRPQVKFETLCYETAAEGAACLTEIGTLR